MGQSTDQLKDFDDAQGEVEERWTEFQFGGERFKVNLNVDGGAILRWMAEGSKIEAVPKLLQTFITDKSDYERLLKTRQPWSKYDALVTWLAEELGGQGNAN